MDEIVAAAAREGLVLMFDLLRDVLTMRQLYRRNVCDRLSV